MDAENANPKSRRSHAACLGRQTEGAPKVPKTLELSLWFHDDSGALKPGVYKRLNNRSQHRAGKNIYSKPVIPLGQSQPATHPKSLAKPTVLGPFPVPDGHPIWNETSPHKRQGKGLPAITKR